MLTPTTEITLTTSPTLGLVAIASGEKYATAHQALEDAGFTRLASGVHVFPLADDRDARSTASALMHQAHKHGVTVSPSRRPYLGDIGAEIAARLPGSWSARLEVYSHPAWQEDLWPALWEGGEMFRALAEHRIPFASVLNNDVGTELLLIERPGHREGYLIGALTEHEKEDVRRDPATPRSTLLPTDVHLAAQTITHTFLPSLRRALHERDLNTVVDALARIREEHETLEAIKASGRFSDGVPLRYAGLVDEFERDFADIAWISFARVLEHAPVLLGRCHPASTAWPEDATALGRLRAALADSQDAWTQWNDLRRDLYSIPATLSHDEWSQVRGQLGLAVLPAIETWVADSNAFERQARSAVPGGSVALSRPSPQLLATRPALPPASPAPTAHR
ncbi:hypothetical protein [Streptomyces seoulensis]|uniref:hypothetical protein n=1 Tax=Streptomyces seoulensis TaxID=73044 RepID=UPI001FCBEE75|nr:hypothetical protein [Streptomyces seoulensis]BDH07210.1 hypothetical protein HEK131_44370 [Streptomyces seoulensis]